MGLMEIARAARRSAIPPVELSYGPWRGSMRSRSADLVPPEYLSGGSEYHFRPRTGTWKRRKGQTQKFDTFGAALGALPAHWTTNGAKCRQLEEFESEGIEDGIPTLIALLTRETINTALYEDDGRFSTVWVRDQVNALNYTLGSEYSATTYPALGGTQTYRYVPLWYDSGDGGLTRGVTEYARRFFVSGSRSFVKTGREWYFPSLLGTPARWGGVSGGTGAASSQFAYPTSETNLAAIKWANELASNVNTYLSVDETTASDADFTEHERNPGVITLNLGATITDPGINTGFKLHVRARINGTLNGNDHLLVTLDQTGGSNIVSSNNCPDDANWNSVNTALTNDWTTYTYTLDAAEAALITDFSVLKVGLGYYTSWDGASTVQVSWVALEVPGTVVADASHLLPSGPLPPVHAGTLAAGAQIENSATSAYPDSDVDIGAWTDQAGGTSSLFAILDETSPSDTDYIKTVSSTATVTGKFGLGDLGLTPSSDDTVIVRYRANRTALASLNVSLVQGASTVIKTWPATPTSATFRDYAVQLTPAEISAVTDWTDLRLWFVKSSAFAASAQVSWAKLEHTLGAESFSQQLEGGWRGSDKFFYAVAGIFEDGSIHMPTVPRGPNELLTSGWNLFQVDASNPTAGYEKVVWSNLPILPHGYTGKALLRSDKIDASVESILQLNGTIPGLRVVWTIKDNVTTTYDDFFADDTIPVLDPDHLLIRDDHIMPPRARYNFAGISRVCHAYGGFNPCAIILAPVGRAADYDLNLPESSDALYDANGMYMRALINDAGGSMLSLIEASASAVISEVDISFTATTTLEQIVDRINATSVAVNGIQWRAQMAPGANPQAFAIDMLTPNLRVIAACVITSGSKRLTRAAGGLAKVAVGAVVGDGVGSANTNVPAGTYIEFIESDTALIMSANATGTATATAGFYFDLGDTVTAGAVAFPSWQRVIGSAFPGFLYFNKTYLDQFPIEKDATWKTVATPLSVQSAPNCFSGKIENHHRPPRDIGISMGGFAVDNGFVVPHSKGNAVIRNDRDLGTGNDYDFILHIISERGCCAWQSVAQGNRCGVFFSPEGWIACDLRDEGLISAATWIHGASDAVAGTGDYDYELPLCVAATAADNDAAYLIAKIMRGSLWVNYRSTGARPNKQVAYDYSDGHEQNGLAAMFRDDNSEWGWGLPLTRALTAMCEGRRGDGAHLYGWNDANAGTVGDGRVDEFETSDTDNGTAISGSGILPLVKFGDDAVSGQEILFEHSTPAGATVGIDFHRGPSDTTFAMTPTTSSSLTVSRDRKLLTLVARSPSSQCYVGFRQSAGGAQEVRSIRLKVLRLRDLKPAP